MLRAAAGAMLVFAAIAPLLPVTALADTGVVDVSNSPTRPEGEESLAVNPVNPQDVVVGSNAIDSNFDLPGGGAVAPCSAWVSHDGGSTWKTVNLNSQFAQGADQAGVFDRHGNAYFVCDLAAAVAFWRSTDGGDTWTGPTLVATIADAQGHVIDRPFIAVDNSGGPRDGTVYVGFESFFTDLITAVYVRSSSDGGTTWSPVTRADGLDFVPMVDPRQYPAVDANGTLYVEYVAGFNDNPLPVIQPSAMSIVVARSTDGGATFTRSAVDSHVQRVNSPYEATGFFFETIAAIATDPRHPGHVAVAWPDSRSGEARIVLSNSVDGGVTWTPPIDVPDDAAGHGNNHDHVSLSYLPDGRIVTVWRDRRFTGGAWAGGFDLFARVVSIGAGGALRPGATVRLTTAPQPTPNCIPCEYFASTAGPEGVSAAWEEMRGANSDVVYRRVSLAGFQAPTPPPVAVPTSTLPNTGTRVDAVLLVGFLGLLVASALIRALSWRRHHRRAQPSG